MVILNNDVKAGFFSVKIQIYWVVSKSKKTQSLPLEQSCSKEYVDISIKVAHVIQSVIKEALIPQMSTSLLSVITKCQASGIQLICSH